MIAVNYPEPSFKLKDENGETFIFDPIRRRWILLTEEEWVRQNFVSYIVHVMKYPVTLIALEKEIYLGELKKRFDILVYNSNHRPWLLVECKSPDVKMEAIVFEQILRYGISVPADFLVITNGNTTYGWNKSKDGLKSIDQLPAWQALH
jgi:hypothetical protein